MDTDVGLVTGNSLGFAIQVSYDGGQTFGNKQGAGWQGGTDPKGLAPYNQLSFDQQLASNATHVLITLSVPQSISVEIDATFS
jgi:hypothetical protein